MSFVSKNVYHLIFDIVKVTNKKVKSIHKYFLRCDFFSF